MLNHSTTKLKRKRQGEVIQCILNQSIIISLIKHSSTIEFSSYCSLPLSHSVITLIMLNHSTTKLKRKRQGEVIQCILNQSTVISLINHSTIIELSSYCILPLSHSVITHIMLNHSTTELKRKWQGEVIQCRLSQSTTSTSSIVLPIWSFPPLCHLLSTTQPQWNCLEKCSLYHSLSWKMTLLVDWLILPWMVHTQTFLSIVCGWVVDTIRVMIE